MEANWSPEEIVQLAKELNNYGTHYRNAVACLYNTFTYELADYWRGANYNRVAEYVNEHYDDFDKITDYICKEIPNSLYAIGSIEAEDGGGSVFGYEINAPGDSAISFNLIPMTEESADGSIQLTEEIAKKYIDGSNEPSLPFYSERMEEYLNSYVNTLEQFSSIKEFNDALKVVYGTIENYKQYSLDVSRNIIAETRLRADVELGKISDADASAKELAVKTLNDYEGDSKSTGFFSENNNKGGYSGAYKHPSENNNKGGYSGAYKHPSENNNKGGYSGAYKHPSESNNQGGYSGAYTRPSESNNAGGTSSGYTTSKATSTSKANNTMFDEPIGPKMPDEIKQEREAQNVQVIQDYLNSDYEKGINDDHVYTINGKEMYIDEIKDNGNSYTVKYWNTDETSWGDDPETMNINK